MVLEINDKDNIDNAGQYGAPFFGTHIRIILNNHVVSFLKTDQPGDIECTFNITFRYSPSYVLIFNIFSKTGKFIEEPHDLFKGVVFQKSHCQVDWDSIIGKIMRKNAVTFNLFKKPDTNFIETREDMISKIVEGVISANLNKTLTRNAKIGAIMTKSGHSYYKS